MSKDILDDLIDNQDSIDKNLDQEIKQTEMQNNLDLANPENRNNIYIDQNRLARLKQAKELHDRNKDQDDEPDFDF